MVDLQTVFMVVLIGCVRDVWSKNDSVVVHGEGAFQINGLFPIRNADKEVNYQSGIMMQEAMRFAVNRINNDPTYLYGYKLKIGKMYDVNKEEEVRKEVLNTFVDKVPFLIGPHTSELSYVTRFLTTTFSIISISYGATFSDFDKFEFKKETMLRTVPSDEFRRRAALDLMQEMEWKYVSVISSYGYNGERDAIHLISNLSSIEACLADQIDLKRTPTHQDYENAIKTLKSDDKVKALVMFTSNEDSRRLLSMMKQHNMSNNVYILCMYGCTNYVEVIKGIEDSTTNVLSLDAYFPEVPDFKKYFLGLKPTLDSSLSFIKFWEFAFNCSFENVENKCTGLEQISEGKGYYPLTPVYTVINAVEAFGKAMTKFLNVICNDTKDWMKGKTQCLVRPEVRAEYSHHILSILQRTFAFPDGTIKDLYQRTSNTSNSTQSTRERMKVNRQVRFDIRKVAPHNGTYKNVHIASWVVNRTDSSVGSLKMYQTWRSPEKHRAPSIFCSERCKGGYVKERDTNPSKALCCWKCVPCPKNSIVVDDDCIQCAPTEMADTANNVCVLLPAKVLTLNKTVPIIFTLICFIGICCVLTVVMFFIRFNKCRLVRASGRDLCYMILCGIFIIFACPFLFFGAPSVSTCVLRNALPGIGFLACYAPLFLKTNRIYRIFCHAKVSVKRPSLVSTRSLLLLAFGIVTVQILLVGVWFISKVPSPIAKVSKDHMYITLHCKGDSSPILLLLNVALSVFFMISCTVLAFKTRHFPKYYNEAKFIGITLYITCVAWSIFLPAYFLIPESDFVREYFMSGICVIIGYITLFGLFGHKIRLLIFQDQMTNENGNFPTWYLSYSSDGKDQGDGMIAHPEHNANSDETIA